MEVEEAEGDVTAFVDEVIVLADLTAGLVATFGTCDVIDRCLDLCARMNDDSEANH